MVELVGGTMVELVGGVTGMPGDVTGTTCGRSAALEFPQMSVTPPADMDSFAGTAPGSKSTYAVSSPGPCRPAPTTAMPAPSASYTRTLPVSTRHTASLNDTLRTPVPASYPADDTRGGAVSSYDMAALSSSALKTPSVPFMLPALTTTYRGCSSPSKLPRASPSVMDMMSPLWKTMPVTDALPSAPTIRMPCSFTHNMGPSSRTSTAPSDIQ